MGWRVVGDQAGSCTIDVWRRYKAVPTGTTYSICRNSEIELSSEQYAESRSLPGWRTNIEPRDILLFKATGVATFETLSVILVVEEC